MPSSRTAVIAGLPPTVSALWRLELIQQPTSLELKATHTQLKAGHLCVIVSGLRRAGRSVRTSDGVRLRVSAGRVADVDRAVADCNALLEAVLGSTALTAHPCSSDFGVPRQHRGRKRIRRPQ